MTTGADQLRDWMKRRGFSLAEAADFFGWDQTFISKLINGRRSPGLANAHIIEAKTGIPTQAWLSIPLDTENEPSDTASAKPQ